MITVPKIPSRLFPIGVRSVSRIPQVPRLSSFVKSTRRFKRPSFLNKSNRNDSSTPPLHMNESGGFGKPPIGRVRYRQNSTNSPKGPKSSKSSSNVFAWMGRMEWALAISVAIIEQIETLCETPANQKNKSNRNVVKLVLKRDVRAAIDRYIKKKLIAWIDEVTRASQPANTNSIRAIRSIVPDMVLGGISKPALFRWGITQIITSKTMTSFLQKHGVTKEALLQYGLCRKHYIPENSF